MYPNGSVELYACPGCGDALFGSVAVSRGEGHQIDCVNCGDTKWWNTNGRMTTERFARASEWVWFPYG
jgi:hypothetical protein